MIATSRETARGIEWKKISEEEFNNKSTVLNTLETLKDNITMVLDENGNTFLHLVAEHSSPDILKLVVERLGEKTTSILCKQVNLRGKTPLLHITTPKLAKRTLEITNILLPFTLDCEIKPLAAVLNIETILSNHPETLTNPILTNNLRMACKAINAIRKDVPQSSSHPETNDVTEEIKTVRIDTLNKWRQSIASKTIRLDEMKKQLKEIATANCGEDGLLVLSHILDMEKEAEVRVEVIYLINADHCFTIIGRKKSSNINDVDSWGENAVIADAWSGEAYPASKKEVYNRLMGFYYLIYQNNEIKQHFNFLCSFNPSYHKLQTIIDCDCKPTFTANQFFITFPVGSPPTLKYIEPVITTTPITEEKLAPKKLSFKKIKITTPFDKEIFLFTEAEEKMLFQVKDEYQCSSLWYLWTASKIGALVEVYRGRFPTVHPRDPGKANEYLSKLLKYCEVNRKLVPNLIEGTTPITDLPLEKKLFIKEIFRFTEAEEKMLFQVKNKYRASCLWNLWTESKLGALVEVYRGRFPTVHPRDPGKANEYLSKLLKYCEVNRKLIPNLIEGIKPSLSTSSSTASVNEKYSLEQPLPKVFRDEEHTTSLPRQMLFFGGKTVGDESKLELNPFSPL